MRVVFVHGACVRDGAWWWQRTAELLTQAEISSETPRLPSCGEGEQPVGTEGAGYEDDVAAVRAVLTNSDEPTVVVAHSYGGMVASEAAADLNTIRHLVYVSSYLAEPGQSLSSFAGGEPAPFLSVDGEAGTFAGRPEMFRDLFMHDCPDDIAAASLDHLAAQSVSVTQHPVRVAAWHSVPSTYVVCANDRATPADLQRTFAERAGHVIELPTGHHPFIAEPRAMADIITGLG